MCFTNENDQKCPTMLPFQGLPDARAFSGHSPLQATHRARRRALGTTTVVTTGTLFLCCLLVAGSGSGICQGGKKCGARAVASGGDDCTRTQAAWFDLPESREWLPIARFAPSSLLPIFFIRTAAAAMSPPAFPPHRDVTPFRYRCSKGATILSRVNVVLPPPPFGRTNCYTVHVSGCTLRAGLSVIFNTALPVSETQPAVRIVIENSVLEVSGGGASAALEVTGTNAAGVEATKRYAFSLSVRNSTIRTVVSAGGAVAYAVHLTSMSLIGASLAFRDSLLVV